MVDTPGNSTTTRTINVGETVSDQLEFVNDHDWFSITLSAGQAITVTVDGITLVDPYLYIRDASGNLLYENDDISAGVIRDSRISFTASQSGTYYLDVAAWQPSPGDEGYPGFTGTYDLNVSVYTPPPVATVDQLANQLVNGYWGGDSHHFNVSQGGSITVNLRSLPLAAQTLARAALATWTDVIGVNFIEVQNGGQIVFIDTENGAFSTAEWTNGIITSAEVNVASGWLASYGTGLNSYSFQTYIHEIGHALGLGHAGNYNVTASYPNDAVFQNDAWPLSVMSYFSQQENTFFAAQGFTESFVLTPMLSDIAAMSTLYGLSTTTRTGNTTYGFNSNAGRDQFNASLHPGAAYAIFDSGGTDTLDYSGFGQNQRINLNAETFSNVGGLVGNVTIGRGVVIENAIGGFGNDTLIANTANNVLNGGVGEDTLSYEMAAAGVQVDLRTTAQQNTVGSGLDTLSGFERLIGSAYGDTLIGSSTTVWIFAGEGNDFFTSTGAGEHRLFGEDGDDWFVAGQGDDWMIGGGGFDTVDYSGATGSINAATNDSGSNTGNSGFDTIGEVEKLIGSNFNDTLWAFKVGHQVWGGAGNDTLKGSALGASQLYGGSGDDIFEVRHAANQVIEAAGEGIDLVMAEANFTLGANIENLTLVQPIYDPYAGATPSGPPFDDFSGAGNNLANVIIGNRGDNMLSGGSGADTLTGGAGNDTFKDTAAGLNGDTITDFSAGDKIVISDASLAGFNFSVSGSTLTFTGGSITLGGGVSGPFYARSAAGGGVQLSLKPIDASNDFNGDGLSDMLLRNSTGWMTNWLGQANGGFANNNANATAFLDPSWTVAASGDFNSDGRDDILLRHSSGWLTNWLGQENGGFANNNANATAFLDPSWTVAATGDFNGDGFDDMLLRHSSGWLTDWLGQPNGGFANNNANASNFLDSSWEIVATGDFNGDGRDDMLLRHSTGWLTNWLGQTNGGFANNNANATAFLDPSWEVVATGDFNGDGFDDLLLRHSSGWLTNWLGKANGGFANNNANATAFLDPSWTVAATGDFNGDGLDDMQLRHSTGWLTNWLGQEDGGFANNNANATAYVTTDWTIHPSNIDLV